MQKTMCSFAAILMLAMPLAHAQQQHAHVHGTGQLSVAVDGNMLQLDIDSPLDNVLGFEHPPRNEKEKRALQAMLDKVHHADTLFTPTAAARCVPQPTQMSTPFSGVQEKTAKGEEHADLEATFSFRCEVPSALKDIDVKMFAAFPNLHTLNVQLVTPKGQSGATLVPSQHKLSW
jgi:hypothetical protein